MIARICLIAAVGVALVTLRAAEPTAPKVSSSSAPQDSNFTFGVENGRVWRMFQAVDDGRLRLVYRRAYRDGGVSLAERVRLRHPALTYKVYDVLNEQALDRATIQDLAAAMDTLYADPSNLNITLPAGVAWCVGKLNGRYTAAELEQGLVGLRVASNSAP